VSIALVARCVASGNILLNEGLQVGTDYTKTEFDRVSLIMDANGTMVELSEAGVPAVAGPLTQLSTVGNVLQGVVSISPMQDPQILYVLNSVTA